ncbi:MAG: lipopolysaccharide biosynthesis protein [Spirochaetales bacterium]|nr:lipopolysaccharide biosynthesis protein [Spirochaetales bacterium]
MHADKMQEINDVGLIDLISIIVRRRFLIIILTCIAMFGSVVFSILSLIISPDKSPFPNLYSPQSNMLINDSSSTGGAFSSMLNSSGLGNLASLAGLSSSSGATYSSLALYLLTTNSFLDHIVENFQIIQHYKIKSFERTTSRNLVKKKMSSKFDDSTGVFSISYTDIDPIFAQAIVNFATKQLEKRFEEIGIDKNKLQKENLERNLTNTLDEIQRLEQASQRLMRGLGSTGRLADGTSFLLESTRLELELEAQKTVYTELKTQYELTKVKMASETPVFQILEYAEVPDQKSGPSRGTLCIIVTFAAFFFSVFLAFLLNAIDNIKKDPEAMAKLKGTRS